MPWPIIHVVSMSERKSRSSASMIVLTVGMAQYPGIVALSSLWRDCVGTGPQALGATVWAQGVGLPPPCQPDTQRPSYAWESFGNHEIFVDARV